MGVLDLPYVRRVRRNHAVEHATIHILTPSYSHVGLAGRADAKGFYLYGRVTTPDLEAAVDEALRRLVAEPELAIHPRCGTNLVVGGFVAGLSALGALATLPDRHERSTLLDTLPRLVVAGTVATIASQSLGPLTQQRVTTLPEVEGVRVVGIQRTDRGGHVVHRVLLQGAG